MQKLKDNTDLVIILGLSFLLLLAVYLDVGGFLRFTIGIIYTLLVPGYVLTGSLFPRRWELTGIERLILSIGLSFILVALVSMLLSIAALDVGHDMTLLVILVLVLLACSLVFYQRTRLPAQNRLVVSFGFPKRHRFDGKAVDALLSAVLVLSVLAVCALFVYALARPKEGERFTEFYLLGAEGLAGEYPTTGIVREPIRLTLGVANREHEAINYRIEKAGDAGSEEIARVQLAHEQTWEQPYTFALTEPGEDQKIDFLLYRDDEEEPYRSLHLWITVREK